MRSRHGLLIIALLALGLTPPWPAQAQINPPAPAVWAKLDPLLRWEFARRTEPAGKLQPGSPAQLSPVIPSVEGPDGVIRIPCWVRFEPTAGCPGWLVTEYRGRSVAKLPFALNWLTPSSYTPHEAGVNHCHLLHAKGQSHIAMAASDAVEGLDESS